MSILLERFDLDELDDRLCDSSAMTAELMSEVVKSACPRLALLRHTERTARSEQLIKSGAWIDTALALIALELPQWQLRRMAYDGGEWYCALSREREMPDWLDQSIEAHHADLPIAILRAFVAARMVSAPEVKSSVPATPPRLIEPCEPMCCDDFG